MIQGPGEIVVPILLYHHIGSSPSGSPYYVSPEEFDRQMVLLYARGYRTITTEQLANAIFHGAILPARPIILTFDDGSETVYTTALPILQKYGFTGTAFIVYNYISAGLYMDVDQIRALHDSGWEIGSHSLSHVNLRQRPGKQEDEISSSKKRLEARLGFPIRVFAYPFGANDASSLRLVREAGYVAAVGLGVEVRQSAENIYYLYRREITAAYDLRTFAGFLPWQEDVNNPPAITIVP
jgi:peptidoglycan/xylan/chitin deacetylase (PgdA/CDA1 family)